VQLVGHALSELESSSSLSDKCKCHPTRHHDFFISYRQASEGITSNGLAMHMWRLLDGAPLATRTSTAFWDRKCINLGQQFQHEFVRFLRSTKVVVLLISATTVGGMMYADQREDNVLLEWELSLELWRRGVVELVLVRVKDTEDQGESPGHMGGDFFTLPNRLPEQLHESALSARLLPDRQTVRQTVKELFKLKMVTVSPSIDAFEEWENLADLCFQALNTKAARTL